MAGAFLEHPSSLEHDTGAYHPEQAARIAAIQRELADRDWLGFRRVSSPPVERELLYRVHAREHVESMEQLSAAGGGAIDLDTAASSGSFQAALHAAGGAVRMVEMLLDGEVDCAFSAHRPPGHHATRSRAMGFCLFDNVAVAAQYALDARGLERVMILDWDVHHGNGTNDIFHASDQVLFVSIHQLPLYPGTGLADDVGSGAGRGFTANLPVPPGSGDQVFTSLVDHVAAPLAHAFRPQLLLISAGYDAHREDSLANCEVTEAGFRAMTLAMRAVSRSIAAPIGCVLEGGYALSALARSVAVTMAALEAPEPEAEAGTSAAPMTWLAEQARSRLAEWWPLG
jgi:acetoin utilization deacetylase AcuC-like enzyme